MSIQDIKLLTSLDTFVECDQCGIEDDPVIYFHEGYDDISFKLCKECLTKGLSLFDKA